MFFLLLAFLINPLNAQVKTSSALEKALYSFLTSPKVEECKVNFPDCEKLYELTLSKEATTTANHFKAMAIFGTIYDFAEACHEGNKLTCDLASAILNDSKDDCQKFTPENNLLCSDVKNFRLNSCDKIKDPLLASVCTKKITSECRSDMVCMITWSFAFRENAESLKLSIPEIIKVFSEQYSDSKSILESDLKIFHPEATIKGDVVRAPLFPAPEKIVNFSVKSKETQTQAPTQKVNPTFRPLATVKNAFLPNMRQLLYPWNRGSGMTVVDWDGDGLLDVFTVDGENLLLFENVDGTSFRKHVVTLTSFGLKGMLSDVSVADIDGNGTPAILVQSFPRTFYVLRWLKERSSFSREMVTLPNYSNTHAIVKFKSGLGIIFPGWSGVGSAPNNMANDYVARIKNKEWSFEKLPNSQAPTLGVSVIGRAPGVTTVVLSRDLEGGTDFYDVSGDALVKIPDSGKMNYFSHSTALLKTSKNEDLWISAGLGFNKSSDKKRIGQSAPKDIEECKNNWSSDEKKFCLLRLRKGLTIVWPSLCSLYKNFEMSKICLVQNENSGIQGVKMPNPFIYTTQLFKNLKSPVIDEAASKIASEVGQVWHMSPLKSPSMEGFLMSEARISQTGSRKLWWMGVTKNGLQKTELTNSLGVPYDATQFALGDFDKDGQLDLVFKSDTDMVFLKGDTGGNSSLIENLQSGYLSRTLINIPVN